MMNILSDREKFAELGLASVKDKTATIETKDRVVIPINLRKQFLDFLHSGH